MKIKHASLAVGLSIVSVVAIAASVAAGIVIATKHNSKNNDNNTNLNDSLNPLPIVNSNNYEPITSAIVNNHLEKNINYVSFSDLFNPKNTNSKAFKIQPKISTYQSDLNLWINSYHNLKKQGSNDFSQLIVNDLLSNLNNYYSKQKFYYKFNKNWSSQSIEYCVEERFSNLNVSTNQQVAKPLNDYTFSFSYQVDIACYNVNNLSQNFQAIYRFYYWNINPYLNLKPYYGFINQHNNSIYYLPSWSFITPFINNNLKNQFNPNGQSDSYLYKYNFVNGKEMVPYTVFQNIFEPIPPITNINNPSNINDLYQNYFMQPNEYFLYYWKSYYVKNKDFYDTFFKFKFIL